MNAWEPIVVTGRDGKVYPASAAARKKRRLEKRKAEQDKAEQEVVIDPITERCDYCNFMAVGTVEETHDAFNAHVCNRPPPPAVSALSRPRRRSWRTRK